MQIVLTLLVFSIALCPVWSRSLSRPSPRPNPSHLGSPPDLKRSVGGQTSRDVIGSSVQPRDGGTLQISLYTNLEFGGDFNVSITGHDPNNDAVMLQEDGQWYYPPHDDSDQPTNIPPALVSIPVPATGELVNVTLPTDLVAGRLWVTQGNFTFFHVADSSGKSSIGPSTVDPFDPDTRGGLVELTYLSAEGLWVDISNVDSVEVMLGLKVVNADGPDQDLQGLAPWALQGICSGLQSQGSVDGYPWEDLCIPNARRVLSPDSYLQLEPNAFAGYWEPYVSEVWGKYSQQSLTFNTQSNEVGNVSCLVINDLLTCPGGDGLATDNPVITFSQPTSADIFGCSSGPFNIPSSASEAYKAVVPRLCAAFHRGTLLLDDGDIQPDGPPSSVYYSGDGPMNWYGKMVHSWQGSQAYTFPYDDVTSDADIAAQRSQSGLIFSATPKVLMVSMGELQAL